MKGIARTLSEIELTVEQIRKADGNAIPISCDVTNYDDMKETMRKVFEHYGRIDIVVINAGTDCKKMPVDELDIGEWKRVMDVNLNGAFYTAKAAIPYLKRNGSGKIITVGSGMGHKGRAESSAYSCSKAGLWMLTRILAQELSEYKISVNEMIPGPVNTSIANYSVYNERLALSLGDEWFKNPSDVTDLAVFLAGQPDIGPTAQSYSLMRRDI